MATSKLFPPTLEGALPAFYKTYTDDRKCTGAYINIPFSLGRAVSINEIYMISMRISTTANNKLIATLQTDQFNFTDENMAYFKIEDAKIAKKFNEGQYYRVQLAFIDNNETVGYYSTVGIIKCVAKPHCSLNNFSISEVNTFSVEVVGVYEQDTYFGDTTEKAYKYRFVLTNQEDQVIIDSGWKIHDATQDVYSESSRDIFKIYTELEYAQIATLEYSVQTINGLTVHSPPYKVMRVESVDLEYPLELYTLANFEDGCIELKLHGVYNHGYIDEENMADGQEAVYTGTFVITRSDEFSEYKEWREITRFVIAGDYASHFGFRDFTVEQGVYYRYGIQQYNVNYLYSEKVLSYDMTPYQSEKNPMAVAKAANNGPVRADFEDMFLFDGKRQLKIRFNPKVTSFKNTIPEQKIETIGSKYPFIFRNGHTNYKEFPIGGLISYTADDSALFLYDQELIDAHILEGDTIRNRTNPYGSIAVKDYLTNTLRRYNWTGTDKYGALEQNYWVNETEERNPYTQVVTKKREYIKYTPQEVQQGKTLKGIVYFDPVIGTTQTWEERRDLFLYDLNDNVHPRDVEGVVRSNRNLTSENVSGERYFKLKVLDWLTDGNIKLFRSPTEGNYLVRLINTQLQPQEQLGRMIHNFTSQAYEIDEATYDNLIYYNIITNATPIITSTLWKSIDLKETLLNQANNQYTEIDFNGYNPIWLYFDDFMPGDTLKIYYKEEGQPLYYIIGQTGNYFMENEGRSIIRVEVQKSVNAYSEYDPIEYSRIVTFAYLGLGSSRFDAIFALKTKVPVAESFVGPKDNLFNFYDISPTPDEYGNGESYRTTEQALTNRILKSLSDREYINYTIGPYANKFKALTIENFHARKRHVIPVYACANLDWDEENQQFKLQATGEPVYNSQQKLIRYNKEGTLFCMTPFGVGYINGKMIYDIDNTNKKVYTISPRDEKYAVDIKLLNLQKVLDELPYLIDYDYEGYDLLKVYVPKVIVEDGEIKPAMKDDYYDEIYDAWQENPDKAHLYYDTYDHTWWPADQEYDPTFSLIAPVEHDPLMQWDKLSSSSGVLAHKDGDLPLDPITDPVTSIVINREHLVDNANPVDTSDVFKISLDVIDEFVLKNLKNPSYLRIGSGVIVEVTSRLQIVDYTVEERRNECYDYKQKYLQAKEDYQNLLITLYKSASEIDGKISSYTRYQNLIEELTNQITKLQSAEEDAEELIVAMRSRIMNILDKMYMMQNSYLDRMYTILKNITVPTTLEGNGSPIQLAGNNIDNAKVNISDNLTLTAAYNNYAKNKSFGLYSRNYYYNKDLQKFYYTSGNVSGDSDQLTIYPTSNHGTIAWVMNSRNGVFTLWSDNNNYKGDVLYNQMLSRLFKTVINKPVVAGGVPVYRLMKDLFIEAGEIPSYITNYGDYRDWLQKLINQRVGEAYALIHYYDSLPTDLDIVDLKDPNKQLKITWFDPTEQKNPLKIENNNKGTPSHPYYDLLDHELIQSKGLLYIYLQDTEAINNNNMVNSRVKTYNHLVQRTLVDEKYQEKWNLVSSYNAVSLNVRDATSLNNIKALNNEAKTLINTYHLKRAICLHKYKTEYNVEKDYYIQPIWLEAASSSESDQAFFHGPGFYNMYIITGVGLPKGQMINASKMNQYLENRMHIEQEDYNTPRTGLTVEQQKTEYVRLMNEAFQSLNAALNDTPFQISVISNGADEQPQGVSYEVVIKYPGDYYYDAAGRIVFCERAKSYFDIPDSIMPLTNNHKTPYYQETDHSYLWNKVNGLLVDDEGIMVTNGNHSEQQTKESYMAALPADIDKNSALYWYHKTISENLSGGINGTSPYSKNSVLLRYTEWKEKCEAIKILGDNYYAWTQGQYIKAGYKLDDINQLTYLEGLEEVVNNLIDEMNTYRYQLRAATVVIETETENNNLSTEKFNELIDLISELVDLVGMSEDEYISFCNLNIHNSNQIDYNIITALRLKKNQLKAEDENVFDIQNLYINRINTIFEENEFVPEKEPIYDDNGNIFTYNTYIRLSRREQRTIEAYLPSEAWTELNNLITLINNYAVRYSYRYKYIISKKQAELLQADNAIILRIRDAFLKELNDLEEEIQNAHMAYIDLWENYKAKVERLIDVFWDPNPAADSLGLNYLILRYQKTLDKADNVLLNDATIIGQLHTYFNTVNEFLKYYYATQIHKKTLTLENGTSLNVGSNINLSGNNAADYSYNYTYTQQHDNSQWTGSLSIDVDQAIAEAGGLLDENADNYFDSFDINYSILESLNTLQLRYESIILDLQEQRSEYENQQSALNPSGGQLIPSELDQEQEKLKILYALAQYLAALGYRYYHEVEMLYKR